MLSIHFFTDKAFEIVVMSYCNQGTISEEAFANFRGVSVMNIRDTNPAAAVTVKALAFMEEARIISRTL